MCPCNEPVQYQVSEDLHTEASIVVMGAEGRKIDLERVWALSLPIYLSEVPQALADPFSEHRKFRRPWLFLVELAEMLK